MGSEANPLFSAAIGLIGALIGAFAAVIGSWLQVRTQHALQKELFRNQRDDLVFTRLHEKQAEVIAGLFSLLVEMNVAVDDFLFIDREGNREAKIAAGKLAIQKIEEAERFHKKNMILFEEQLNLRIKSVLDFARSKGYAELLDDTQMFEDSEGLKRWNTFNEKSKILLEEMNKSFQVLLGVSSAQRKAKSG